MNISINNNEILDVAMRFVAKGTSQDLETFFLTAWSIWYNRNQKVFEDNCRPPTQLWNFARKLSHDFMEASNTFCDKQSSLKEGWSPPPLEIYKVNVNGATSNDGQPSSIGVIIRISKGETIAALCMPLPGEYFILETEAIAVEKGALLAREMELQQVIFEFDVVSVFNSVNASDESGYNGHLFQGIMCIINSSISRQFKHLKRAYNKVAHELAQHAKCYGTNQVWKWASPPMMQHMVQSDCS